MDKYFAQLPKFLGRQFCPPYTPREVAKYKLLAKCEKGIVCDM
jgi:hypothetical protein